MALFCETAHSIIFVLNLKSNYNIRSSELRSLRIYFLALNLNAIFVRNTSSFSLKTAEEKKADRIN